MPRSLTLVLIASVVLATCSLTSAATDPRNIRTGSVIPDEGYCDQPYVVITKDGNWLCTFTTGKGHEGQGGQHVVASISTNQGKTWSDPPIDIEPADGPAASWVMPLVTPSGRIYVFYDYNGDRINTLGKRKNIRADMLGWYVYKYSDDGGRTWSKQRYRLPVRVTACDRANDWQGRVQIMWGIGKPIIAGSSVYFGFTKLGRYMLENGEGWFFRSDNILTERDVNKIEWQMLPDGEHGLRAPAFGSIQEEHNLVDLPDGLLYCIYRTTTGHPCHAYSRDGAHTWTRPVHATYTPDGRKIKTPRACPRLWKTRNGKYLLWYHNHSGKDFKDRNPAWIVGGRAIDGRMHWGEPEIVLYDPDPNVRMSYPDLIEQDGCYWITETQKDIARVHKIDPSLLEGLWNQTSAKTVTRKGLALEWSPSESQEARVAAPRLPELQDGGGFTIDMWVVLRDWAGGQTILDSRDANGTGIAVTVSDAATIRIELSDGTNRAAWDCDPGLLRPNQLHHVAIIVDGGPKIITFVIDGQLCDGGTHRQYGWGRFSDNLRHVNGQTRLRMAPSLKGKLEVLRIYNRYLRTSEAVINYRAGRP